jgi:16S rRNA (cytosine1402-N4)-methyltransferase
MDPVHRPVLLEEVLSLLAPGDGAQILVDATLGEGGHSDCFLQRFPRLSVVGIDADYEMLERARERLSRYGERVRYVNAWFDEFFTDTEVSPNRVLLDLGISMYHFSLSGRGFSFKSDEPLDMRLDVSGEVSAARLVNTLPEHELAHLIYSLGEERLSRRIASAICRERAASPVNRAKQLSDLIWRIVPPSYRHGRIHPATRTFQALRIAVNAELERVIRAIPLILGRLPVTGRLGIISFHSLEDRLVKHTFRDAASSGAYHVITKKPVVPGDQEIRENPPARSAKLRVIERVEGSAA